MTSLTKFCLQAGSKMNKRMISIIGILIFISAVFAEDNKVDWEKSGAIQSDPAKFANEVGLNSLSGELSGVTYNKNDGTISNGKITLSLSQVKGAEVIALSGGGFEIKKSGSFKIQSNTYSIGEGQSVKLNADGSVSLSKGSIMETYGRTITAEGQITVSSSQNSLKIKGPATIVTEDKRIFIKGNNLNIQFVQKLPSINSVQAQQGNQVY